MGSPPYNTRPLISYRSSRPANARVPRHDHSEPPSAKVVGACRNLNPRVVSYPRYTLSAHSLFSRQSTTIHAGTPLSIALACGGICRTFNFALRTCMITAGKYSRPRLPYFSGPFQQLKGE